MEINFACPHCKWGQDVEDDSIAPEQECDHCHMEIDMSEGACVAGTTQIDHCFVCGGNEFYRQKDFNRKVGLIIIIFCALASIFVGNYLPLGLAVVVDLAIFYFLPYITLCYQCKAIYRDIEPNPAHGRFELATHDKYRT